jgi:cell division protein FtsW
MNDTVAHRYSSWDSTKEWLRNNLKGDIVIWVVVLLLALFSLPLVYSATGTLAYQKGGGYPEYFLLKHAAFTALGIWLMWFVHKLNYTVFAKLSGIALFISLPLLALVKVAGVNINGATRWLAIPFVGLTFQPADFARLALILNLALMLSRRQKVKKYDWSVLYRIISWICIICFLIILTSSSTAILLGATCFVMMYIGRVPAKYLLILSLIIATFGGVGMLVGERVPTIKSRIEGFKKGNVDQALQSKIAIANGGIFGQGIGNSHQRNYLTQAYSDFIYAIIIEEYGLVGGVIVLLLYLILLIRGVQNISLTTKPFSGILSAGLTLNIVAQAFVNMAVAVGLGPVTGQPLPLLSMGGTSGIFTCISLGIILSISRGDVDESNL